MIPPINLTDETKALFVADGRLARLLPGYRVRAQQSEMATTVAAAIHERGQVMIEAGTGTGKTLAYLLPALASGGRILIATGTKTLQDQLFYQDLPLALKALGKGVRVALLKGRTNYLCPERLERNMKVMGAVPKSIQARLTELRIWFSSSRTGDLTEVIDIETDSALLPLVTSSAENCLGSDCPKIAECPVFVARRRAAEADLVVVNHHLLFADMALTDESVTSMLPNVTSVIIDEAHQIADVARQFFGLRISSNQLAALGRDVLSECARPGREDPLLAACARRLEDVVRSLVQAFRQRPGLELRNLLSLAFVRSAVEATDLALAELGAALDACAGKSAQLTNCHLRTRRLADRFAIGTERCDDEDMVHWIEYWQDRFVIHLAPVSVAEYLGPRVRQSGQGWVFTSATLTIGGSFDHFRAALGLPEVDALQLHSPFDFPAQVKGWIPPLIAKPGSDDHTQEMLDAMMPVLRSVPGRTFFLFTSYRALRLAAERLAAERDVHFVVQGQQSKQALLASFGQIENCVLLATMSFWEGVDVRGQLLRCVIIDKLPFSSPDQPFTRARMLALETAGVDGFFDFMIPDAAIRLRQGFGRLIREEADRGLFVLCDPRVTSRAYGGMFLSTLPTLDWLGSQRDAIHYLNEIGTT